MIYVKAIRSTQLIEDVHDFKVMHKDYLNAPNANAVYCVGETTEARGKYCPGAADLYAVPLSMVYDCLKYGDLIAILSYQDAQTDTGRGCVVSTEIAMKEQTVIKVFPADSKEAIDFLLDNVEGALIHMGYIDNLSDEIASYFRFEIARRGFQSA